jgi:hypothetical protein
MPTKYRPGSFSKNFAWHDQGLAKLHKAVRDGFGGHLSPTSRDKFRERTGLGAWLSLIPANFFLHNADDRISIDELVFRALAREHSASFDRLGLFALHLNSAGNGKGVMPRPAMWANEFVRDKLWSNGAWHRAALAEEEIDPFLSERLDAQPDVRTKCRTNYVYLFRLCGYMSADLDIINTFPEQWITSAIFLAWDRYTIEHGSQDVATLLNLVRSEELHKLLGMGPRHVMDHARIIVDRYIQVGGTKRFLLPDAATETDLLTTIGAGMSGTASTSLTVLDQEDSDDLVERTVEARSRQLRRKDLAAAVKTLYNNRCMFCGVQLEVGRACYYAEAAHIRGLGLPHNGPDKAGNLLVLCPNHHLQFDRGMLRLKKRNGTYVVVSKSPSHPLHETALLLKHDLDEKCVTYHYAWFADE